MRLIVIVLLLLSLFVVSDGYASIVVIIRTSDGLIIVADSRLSSGERVVSDSYQKIIRIGRDIAISFTGAAFLVDENGTDKKLRTLIQEFNLKHAITDTADWSPDVVVKKLGSFLLRIYNSNDKNYTRGIQVKVLGYDEKKAARVFDLQFQKKSPQDSSVISVITEQYPKGETFSAVLGQNNVWHRIVKGYDQKLKKMALSDSLKSYLETLRYDIRYNLMSLQDAIDFGVFIVRATIEAQRFNHGGNTGVGGAIDVAIITPNGFKWIQRKKLKIEGQERDLF